MEDVWLKKYNMLTIIDPEPRLFPSGDKKYKCLCDCGNITWVPLRHLRSGNTGSCGCLRFMKKKDKSMEMTGIRKTPEHTAWNGMRSRVLDKSNHMYYNYGGAGVDIAERWRSFANFLEDMGPKPSPYHQLHRYGHVGNYEPGNVCWSLDHSEVKEEVYA